MQLGWPMTGLAAVLLCSGCTAVGVQGIQRSLSTTPWGYQLVGAPHPVYRGPQSQRFEVRAGDCGASTDWSDCASDRERSEVTADNARFAPGSDVWMSFMIFLPPDFQTSTRVNTDLGQIHMRGGFQSTAGGFRSHPPLLQLNAKGNTYTACFHVITGDAHQVTARCQNQTIARLSEMRGRWSRITLHLKATPQTPAVEVFFNRQRVAHFQHSLPRDPREYYLKYGVYRSFVSRHGKPMPTQVVYYDEVKIGSSQAAVEDEQRAVD